MGDKDKACSEEIEDKNMYESESFATTEVYKLVDTSIILTRRQVKKAYRFCNLSSCLLRIS